MATTRRKSDVKTTLLCATRFWSIDGGKTATLQRSVRMVVRRQGFAPKEIDQAARELVREGKLEIGGHRIAKTIRLTDKGNKISCARVKLAPWTDDQYPGSALTGSRKRRRR